MIELSNGDIVVAGQLADRDVTEESKRRIQIREVIRAHLDEDRQLFAQDIKVLSLFFIDEVAKVPRLRPGRRTSGTTPTCSKRNTRLRSQRCSANLRLTRRRRRTRHTCSATRWAPSTGYFTIDKKTSHLVDPAVVRRGEQAGQSSDADAYDLILKNKERLLSLDEPVRFIFSHSALRGMGQPKRVRHGDAQEERQHHLPSPGDRSRTSSCRRPARRAHGQPRHRSRHQRADRRHRRVIHRLCCRPAEGNRRVALRPTRKAKVEFFEGKVLQLPTTGDELTITNDSGEAAAALAHGEWLHRLRPTRVTDKWRSRADIDIPKLPAGLDPFHYQVAELVDSLIVDIPQPTDGRKPKRIPLNEANFAKKEFQELWGRINHKAVYQVAFDSAELIDQVRHGARHQAPGSAAPVRHRQAGEQAGTLEAERPRKGEGFSVKGDDDSHMRLPPRHRRSATTYLARSPRRLNSLAERRARSAGRPARHVREVPAESRAVHHRGGATHQRAEGHRDRRASDVRHARRAVRHCDLHGESDRAGLHEGRREAQQAHLRLRRHRIQGRAQLRHGARHEHRGRRLRQAPTRVLRSPRRSATTTPTGRSPSRREPSSTCTSSPRPKGRCRRSSSRESRKPRSSAPDGSSRHSVPRPAANR